MQYEIKKRQYLLDESGTVISAGWSKAPNFIYDKDFSGVSRFKLKERDCYYISNKELGIYITASEYGIHTVISVTIINFLEGLIYTRTVTKYFSLGQTDMPMSSEHGDVTYADNQVGINFANTSVKRYIKCDFVDFCEGKNLYINLILEEKCRESLNVAIPFREHNKCFFLKRFFPAMTVSGLVRFGGYEYNLRNEYSTAYLDWSRYAVPKHSFYHAVYINSIVTGKQFALCLSFGSSGDTVRGSENCFFYDGIIHKLSTIKAAGNETYLNKPWHFFSLNNNLDLNFRPITAVNGLMSVNCDKRTLVFGTINGKIASSDCEPIMLQNIPAHMEFTIL